MKEHKKMKILWWSLAGVGVLVLALIVSIVNNKPKPVTVKEEAPLIETSASEILADEPAEASRQEDSITEEPKTEGSNQPDVPSTNESTDGQSATAPSKVESKDVPNTTPTQPSTQEPAQKPVSPQVQEQSKPAPFTSIKSGTYQVGSDIAPGEYIVFSNGMTFLENSKDQTGNPDSTVFNIALDGRSHTYVTLLQGEYFKLDGGEMYPIAKAPDLKPANGVYKSGQYKVGTDIPAGQLKLIIDNTNDIGFYEISKNSRQEMMDLIISDVVEGDTYIDVVNGQYLTIRNAYIEVK
ncbi:hypothetical protein CSV79_14995 [Sporosarcina sp. P13]|uniref:hypothetical protein n=1 Tax=Sporosarcina sp. P13 TaxID=2048263 RepID=UPI000C16AC4C|nr:hypothetical protein [Sporosarcina sp. P13]PIC62842.1 hypothetical protein CSV79_14995 [Sporosarcina sp. P13]